ncbi:unnamed protein product [Dicrocoelium dendriticum]|nr:unnamed protein product [Dicrocoelium dendriticum]
MISVLILDSGVTPTQAPFGPHALLPDTEFRVVWKFLRCTQCRYRLLYHRCILRECRESRKNLPGKRTPRAQPLHSLTRAIKAVLHGLSLNRRLSKKIVCASSVHSVAVQQEFTALVKTAFGVQSVRAVCLSHARELFALLYLNDDDDSANDNSASFRNVFIPRGRSCFYQTTSCEDDDEGTDEGESGTQTEPCRRLTLETQHVVSNTFSASVCSIELRSWNGTVAFNCEPRSALPDLVEINSKWNSYYSTGERTTHLPTTIDRTSRKTRHVHFPPGHPVSATHKLITYALASQLERSDRIWENEARHRIFDSYRRLVCKGYDPSTASEIANACTDDDSGSDEYVSRASSDIFI